MVIGSVSGFWVLYLGFFGVLLPAAGGVAIARKGPRGPGAAGMLTGIGLTWTLASATADNFLSRLTIVGLGLLIAGTLATIAAFVSRDRPRRRLARPQRPIRGSRRLGAAIGLGISMALIAFGWLADQVAAPGLVRMLGLPTVVAGVVAGLIVGPRADRARTQRDWVGAVWRLATVAVLVGDLVVSIQVASTGPSLAVDGAGSAAAQRVSLVVVLWVIGLVLFGWFGILCTSAAGGVWAACYGALRGSEPERSGDRRVDGAPTSSRP